MSQHNQSTDASEHRDPNATRRRFLDASIGGAALLATGATDAAGAPTLRQVEQHNGARSGRLLVKGGTIVSMDPRIGDLLTADILVEGTRIEEIGTNLAAGDSLVIDASGKIVCPGMIDSHRHSWQGQWRRMIPSGDLPMYVASTHWGYGPHYRAEDVYAGNYITAVSNINSGVTGLLDYSHIRRSPEHADAAVEALVDAGVRAQYTCARPPASAAGPYDNRWFEDLPRIKKRFFSSEDQLVTLGVGTPLVEENYRLGRSLGIRIATDPVFGKAEKANYPFPDQSPMILKFEKAGLLGPDVTFVHCAGLSDEAWRAIKASGTTIALAPTSDAQYMQMAGLTPIQAAMTFGVQPSLSIDADVGLSSDMWTQMRTVVYAQRLMIAQARANGRPDPGPPITVRDALQAATVGGAMALGLTKKVGTLAPGKEADLLLVDSDELGLPLNNAYGTLVQGADTKSVHTVVIGGKIRKWAGQLVGVDLDRLRARADDSRRYLIERSGREIDVFSDEVSPPKTR